MKKATSIEITHRTLSFLNEIKDAVQVTDFLQLEHTGNPEIDALLSKVCLSLLEHLSNTEMVDVDDLKSPDAKVYGLTEKGPQMRQLFNELTLA